MLTIYLAGPITGLDLDDVHRKFHDRADALEQMGYRVLHPMLGKKHLLGQGLAAPAGYEDPISNDRAIFGRDRFMVGQADIVLADLTAATKPSMGTCFELAWASDHPGTLVITTGLHVGHAMFHAFVREASDHIFVYYQDALDFLEAMAPAVRPDRG